MSNIIELNSRLSNSDQLKYDIPWEEMYHRLHYISYPEFIKKIDQNPDKLICWNPHNNEEIICDNDEINDFALRVENASRNTDVFIHLGKQWIEKYDCIVQDGQKRYIRSPNAMDFFPNNEKYMDSVMLKILYYMLIKPSVVSYYGKLMDGMADLDFFDSERNELLEGDEPEQEDLISCVFTYNFLLHE